MIDRRHGDHRDLLVWQKAMELACMVHCATNDFPRAEAFGLTSQIRRASVSIPSNIAEGSARRTTAELVHFLHIARGSQAELDTQLRLSERFGYLSPASAGPLLAANAEIGRLLTSFLSALRRRLGR